MDARELRIGNWVKDGAGRLMQINLNHFLAEWFWNAVKEGEITGAPLTEEIIKSCVGIEDNGLSGCEFDLGAGSALWFLDPQWYITNPDAVNSSMATDVKVPYVHSLQNLYFALTGEDLQFKTLG